MAVELDLVNRRGNVRDFDPSPTRPVENRLMLIRTHISARSGSREGASAPTLKRFSLQQSAVILSNGLPFSQQKSASQNCFSPTVELWYRRSLCPAEAIQHRRSATVFGSLRGSNPPSSCCSFLPHPCLLASAQGGREDRHDSWPTGK